MVQFMAVAYVQMITMIVAVVVIFAFSSIFKKFVDYQGQLSTWTVVGDFHVRKPTKTQPKVLYWKA